MRDESITIPELVAACLDRHETGGMIAVDELLEEHPHHAREVRKRLGTLLEAGLLAPPEDGEPVPDRLGPFRLLKRIGGGGMGIVYLAEQEPLGRRVAIKLIRPDYLYFDRARERFRREIEVVSMLKHPGIVPVYSGGEAEGIPYYAMEYVEGRSLDGVIRSLRGRDPAGLTRRDLLAAATDETASSEPHRLGGGADAPWGDACVDVALQLASALEHAHGRSVLHRDVKPSNIMLLPDGRVLLLDFGLASTRTTSRLTRTDAQIGSLPYMSPEQLRGRDVDERSDIYALGVTLYELLCLGPPYFSADPEETRRLVLHGAPRPLRRVNRSLSWDVETVCQVAMELEPARRYANAGAFARDLRAVLDRRPITARRSSPILRAKRLVQRRPTASVAVSLGVVLVVFGALAWARDQRLARATKEADSRRQDAETQARAGFERALDATDEMLRSARHSILQDHPSGDELVRRLLEDARRIQAELLVDYPEDPELRLAAAIAWNWEAHRRRVRGELAGADEALRQSLPVLHALAAERPDDLAVRDALVFAQQQEGALVNAGAKRGESLDWTRAALELRESTLDALVESGASPDELFEARYQEATERVNVGVNLVLDRRPWEALEHLSCAAALMEELVLEKRTENALFSQMTALLNLAGLWAEVGRPAEAERMAERSLEIGGELLLIDPRPNYEVRAIIGAREHRVLPLAAGGPRGRRRGRARDGGAGAALRGAIPQPRGRPDAASPRPALPRRVPLSRRPRRRPGHPGGGAARRTASSRPSIRTSGRCARSRSRRRSCSPTGTSSTGRPSARSRSRARTWRP